MLEKIKQHRAKLTAAVVIVLALVLAFWYGGGGARLRGWSASDGGATEMTSSSVVEPEESAAAPSIAAAAPTVEATPATTQEIAASTDVPTPQTSQTAPAVSSPAQSSGAPVFSEAAVKTSNAETGGDQYLPAPVPEGNPEPVEPEDAVIGSTAYTCTISVSCSTLLDNMSLLDEEKKELVPDDGWILEPVAVTFYEGESVFNTLQRTLKQNGIQMEYVNTPIYNSAYIEGIGNLYEFDAGELSGWEYRVNSWFPGYGCSRYQLQDGDVVEWVYTCDLGEDVGGSNAAG